ncbi:MAG: hypothetical protein RQ757_07620 [Pseudomonadales bacterium]|nr:hypothetical protein [Pseudomonadales bacterium]
MNETAMPASLAEAIATEPMWLQVWVLLLVVSHFAAIAFMVYKEGDRWRFRGEPFAILGSFFVAALILEWLFAQVGYVRLLGLGHLLGWTPVYLWILLRRRQFDLGTLYGKYIHVYLLIAGTSLLIDALDVIRYLLGDGQL